MIEPQPSRPLSRSIPFPTYNQRDTTLLRLMMPVRIEDQSCLAIRAIVGIRLLAICSRSGTEALPMLTQRLASVTAAKAFIAFADLVGTSWPENFNVMRPCCRVVSPDEATLAQMVDAAASGNRARFNLTLDGFVRSDRQDALFERAAEAAALIA